MVEEGTAHFSPSLSPVQLDTQVTTRQLQGIREVNQSRRAVEAGGSDAMTHVAQVPSGPAPGGLLCSHTAAQMAKTDTTLSSWQEEVWKGK